MSDPLTRVPELVQGLDVRTLPLSALEGFVLSRIDGRAPVREVVAMTGLPADQVLQMLDRLCSLGAARWKGEPGAVSGVSAKPVVQAPPARRKSSGSHPPVRRVMGEGGISQPPPDPRRLAQHTPTRAPTPTPHAPQQSTAHVAGPSAAPARYDLRELDEECELPRERRKQVLDLFYGLRELDFYEVLEIPYDADKKVIRTAYFGLSKSFHPDTMFRKELGSFKAKMVAVFQYLTEAYDTLSRKKTRDEYDAYLQSTKATAMADRGLLLAAREQAETARALAVEVPPPPPLPGSFGPTAAGGQTGEREVEVAPLREASDEARRLAQEVIARRMRGVIQSSSIPVREGPPVAERPKVPSDRTPSQDLLLQLGRALKGANEATATITHDERLKQLVDASQRALGSGELEEATKLMRRALSVAPERSDLRAEYEQLSKQLSERLADEYAVQGRFEAKHGKWALSAVAWAKVCEVRPQDVEAHRRTAFALFKVGGDLRSAQKYAQQAAFLAPNDVDARVLLAQIYLTLGLKLNARRELDAALKLDPGSEIVKNLLSDLKG